MAAEQQTEHGSPKSTIEHENLIHPDLEELTNLPDAPYNVSVHDDAIYITERAPSSDPFLSKELRALHNPAPATETRLQELQVLAEYAGYDDIGNFISATVAAQDLQSSPSYLVRRITEQPTALEVLREIKRAALEQEYTTRALEIAKEMIKSKLPPQFVPQENTLAFVDDTLNIHALYKGRFGGNHLMVFSGKDITKRDIDALNPDSESVVTAVHELMHQRHTEIQDVAILAIDLPNAAAFNEIKTDDPWEVYRLRAQYLSEIDQTGPLFAARAQLKNHITETVAYLAEAEVVGEASDITNSSVGFGAGSADFSLSEHKWLAYFASLAPLGQRTEIIARLMAIDLKSFAHLSAAQLTEIINNPQAI